MDNIQELRDELNRLRDKIEALEGPIPKEPGLYKAFDCVCAS